MTAPGAPESAAVLGAGTIGLSGASWLAAHGTEVTIVTRREESAAAAPALAARRLERLVALGALTDHQVRLGRARLRAAVGVPQDAGYALILEAVVEDLDVKRAVLGDAEAALADDGVIVTTTSSMPIEELAGALARPERFAAWHWFHPADLMPLVEIIPAARTDAVVVDRLSRWSAAIAKRAITLTRDTPGFVANRLQYALLREAYALVEAGVCQPADVDTAVTAGLGARWAAIGPFASMDLAGLAVHGTVAERLFPQLSNATDVPVTLSRLRAEGAGGAHGGRGLLGRYPDERRAGLEERRDRTLVALQRGDL